MNIFVLEATYFIFNINNKIFVCVKGCILFIYVEVIFAFIF